jgi:hypothetical protein
MSYAPQPGADQQRISQVLQEAATDPQCLRASCGPTQQDIAFQNSSNEYNQPPNEGDAERQVAERDNYLSIVRSDRALTPELTTTDIAAVFPPFRPVRALTAPRAYSVVFETTLSEGSRVASRGAHIAEANEALYKAMQESPELAQSFREMGIEMGPGARGAFPRTSPPGWTWHHELEPGLMRLVPREQHTIGSPWWNVLHPGGVGGYSVWGQ